MPIQKLHFAKVLDPRRKVFIRTSVIKTNFSPIYWTYNSLEKNANINSKFRFISQTEHGKLYCKLQKSSNNYKYLNIVKFGKFKIKPFRITTFKILCFNSFDIIATYYIMHCCLHRVQTLSSSVKGHASRYSLKLRWHAVGSRTYRFLFYQMFLSHVHAQTARMP